MVLLSSVILTRLQGIHPVEFVCKWGFPFIFLNFPIMRVRLCGV